MIEILVFIVFGAMTGLIAGLLGIGGGVIAVPVFYFTLGAFDFPQGDLMHVAVATSLASTVITAFGASWSHHQKKAVRFDALKPIALGLFFGCAIGVILTYCMENDVLRFIFGSAVLPLSLYFFFPKLPSPNFNTKPNWTLTLCSIFVGGIATMLGVGGGIFFVPILLGYHLPMNQAIATSSSSTLFSAFFATCLFLLLESKQPDLPHTFGYIYIPGFLILGLSSLLLTPLGAKLAQTLPIGLIKRIFAVALAITGITMLIGGS